MVSPTSHRRTSIPANWDADVSHALNAEASITGSARAFLQSCYLDASVGRVSHSLEQAVKLWIESDGEGTVYDST